MNDQQFQKTVLAELSELKKGQVTLEKGQASLAQEVTDIKTDIRRLDDKFDRLDTKVTILDSKVNEIADDSKVTRQYLDQAFEHISGLKFPRVSRLVRRK